MVYEVSEEDPRLIEQFSACTQLRQWAEQSTDT